MNDFQGTSLSQQSNKRNTAPLTQRFQALDAWKLADAGVKADAHASNQEAVVDPASEQQKALLEQAIAAIHNALEQQQQAAIEWKQQLPAEVVQLAVSLAQKVLDCELKANPDALMKGVTDVLSAVNVEDEKELRFHPEDINSLQKRVAQKWHVLESLPGLTITPDEDIQQGTCRLELSTHQLEFDCFHRLDLLRDELQPKESHESTSHSD